MLVTTTSIVLLASESSDRASKEFWESTTKKDRWATDKAAGYNGFKTRKQSLKQSQPNNLSY
jgi:hypothetical protein